MNVSNYGQEVKQYYLTAKEVNRKWYYFLGAWFWFTIVILVLLIITFFVFVYPLIHAVSPYVSEIINYLNNNSTLSSFQGAL